MRHWLWHHYTGHCLQYEWSVWCVYIYNFLGDKIEGTVVRGCLMLFICEYWCIISMSSPRWVHTTTTAVTIGTSTILWLSTPWTSIDLPVLFMMRTSLPHIPLLAPISTKTPLLIPVWERKYNILVQLIFLVLLVAAMRTCLCVLFFHLENFQVWIKGG